MTGTVLSQPNDVREKPILFSGEMVRAILAGTKTQTRPVVVKAGGMHRGENPVLVKTDHKFVWARFADDVSHYSLRCPYGTVGNRLWVRETFYCDDFTGGAMELAKRCFNEPKPSDESIIAEWRDALYYRADGEPEWEAPEGRTPWRPSIHMPRWASRITLEITGVRVERLQEITDADCEAEGIGAHMFTVGTPQPLHWTREHSGSRCRRCAEKLTAESEDDELDGGWRFQEEDSDAFCEDCDVPLACLLTPYGMRKTYRHLWDSINEKRGYGWATNPWVWVIEFKRLPILPAPPEGTAIA